MRGFFDFVRKDSLSGRINSCISNRQHPRNCSTASWMPRSMAKLCSWQEPTISTRTWSTRNNGGRERWPRQRSTTTWYLLLPRRNKRFYSSWAQQVHVSFFPAEQNQKAVLDTVWVPWAGADKYWRCQISHWLWPERNGHWFPDRNQPCR